MISSASQRLCGRNKLTGLLFVETRTDEKRKLLCKWVEHFYENGRKVQVSVDSTTAAQNIDQLLWTFSQGSFIPHKIISTATPQPFLEPVAIAVGQIKLQELDVLIADASVGLDIMEQFDLVVHFILMDDPEKRQESRLLWQAAKERGFQLQHSPYPANLIFPAVASSLSRKS